MKICRSSKNGKLSYKKTKLTSEVTLWEEVLYEVSVWEQKVVELVHAHANNRVDMQSAVEVRTERLHLTCGE